MSEKKSIKSLVFFVILLILLDQVSKLLIKKYLLDEYNLISNILIITKLENEGFAFGLNKQNIINIFLIIIILSLLVKYMIEQNKNITKSNYVFLSMILAGGISNLIDRIFKGAVFDFIKIYNFPVFNFADVFIVIGWILFVINFVIISYKDIKLINNKGV